MLKGRIVATLTMKQLADKYAWRAAGIKALNKSVADANTIKRAKNDNKAEIATLDKKAHRQALLDDQARRNAEYFASERSKVPSPKTDLSKPIIWWDGIYG